jgi:EF hand
MKSQKSLQPAAIALLLALSAMAAAPALAQQSSADSSFESLDKNHDGHLTRSEIPADMPLLRTRLSTYDADQDGRLDAKEYAAAKAALQGSDKGTSGDHPSSSSSGH